MTLQLSAFEVGNYFANKKRQFIVVALKICWTKFCVNEIHWYYLLTSIPKNNLGY